ncbi:hypothetical protein [Armatimonas sp.]|uniref:hypothetical protein n=1 Tax=Armatimonas sp. TaxID=1872638 RepID=UPI0037506894
MDNVENTVELTAAEKLAQFEKEKLSRRQALARFGFQAGAAAVAALTADDLLRKVGKEMQRRAGDNKIALQVAKEFQEAGIAFATPPTCEDCCTKYWSDYLACTQALTTCLANAGSNTTAVDACIAADIACRRTAYSVFTDCYHSRCPAGYQCQAGQPQNPG